MTMNERRDPRTPARRQAMLDRASAKSAEQVAANNLPRVLRRSDRETGGEQGRTTVWAVASRTEAGVIYLVTESAAGELDCDCPAECLCWHKVHVSRALAGEIGHLDTPRPRLSVSLTDINIYGRRVPA